jgi:cytoskeletal protein CcmA (bactofilin family)
MMIGLIRILMACAAMVMAGQTLAETTDRTFGGDIFRAGESTAPFQAGRDVFATGATVTLQGEIAEDAHAVGFDVDADAATGGDLYLMGFSVSLRGSVAGDLTASGFSVRTAPDAEIAGNARLTGAKVTIEGPVGGAVMAVGGTVTLDAQVDGDVFLTGETLVFGKDARIGGALTYSAPTRMDIPESVVAADRITFEPYHRSDVMKDAQEMWSDWEYPVLPTFMSVLGAFLVTVGFFVVIGALFLALVPNRVRHLRRKIEARPGKALLFGAMGLSILFGLVPISALTVIGLPLVPIVLLGLVAIWTLGYILGAYALTMRVLHSFGSEENPKIWVRLVALVIGVTVASLLNFIPVLGWMANFALVLLGIGGMSMALFDRMNSDAGPVLDTPQ